MRPQKLYRARAAKLRLEYNTGTYPLEFTDDVLVYIERSFLSTRQDGEALGVMSFSE